MAVDYYKLYSDPRFYSLPQDVKESLEKGEISFDDINLVDLGQAEQDYQRRVPRPVVPEFASGEAQKEDIDPGLWSTLKESFPRATETLRVGLPAVAKTLPATLTDILPNRMGMLPTGALREMNPFEELQQEGAKGLVEGLPRIIEAEKRLQKAKEGLTGVEGYVADVASSAPSAILSALPILSGTVVGGVTKSPAAGFAAASATGLIPSLDAYVNAYVTAKRNGKDDEFSHKYATGVAGLEQMFEMSGVKGASSVIKTIAKKGLWEGFTESGTEAYQDILNQVVLPEEASKTPGEALYGQAVAFGGGAAAGTALSTVGARGESRQIREEMEAKKAEEDRLAALIDAELGGIGAVDPAAREAQIVANEAAAKADAEIESMLKPSRDAQRLDRRLREASERAQGIGEASQVQDLFSGELTTVPDATVGQETAPQQPEIVQGQEAFPFGGTETPNAARMQDIQGPALKPQETTTPLQATPVPPQPTAAPQQPTQEPQGTVPPQPRTRPLTQEEMDQGEDAALTPEERDVIAREVEAAATDVGADQATAERERSANRVAALRQSLEENEATRGLVNLPRVSIVSRQDRANVPEGVDLDNDYGGYDRDTGQLYLNADKIAEDIESGGLPEGYGVAVALHEIAHPFDASGKRTGKRSVDNLLGDNRDALRQRVTDLANGGNRVAQTALKLAGDNDFEVLTYFIEEAKKSRLEGKGMGRRAVNLLNDIISSIKGFITDNLGVDFKVTESDILRAADLMAKDFVKTRGAIPKDKGGVLKSFGGVKAKNAPLADYARAEELEIAGASPRQIWSETGWRRGVDDKWRFEIDDSRAKLTPEWTSLRVADQSVRSQKPLGKILDHDGILKNYPQLQKLPILKEKMKSTSKGYFMPGADGQPGYIAVNPNLSEKEALSVILHEAQHAIQMVENFAQGGSAESVWRNMSSEEKATSKEHAKKFLETRRAQNKEKLDGLRKKDPATLSKVEKKSLEVLQKNILKDTNDLRSLAKGDEAVLKSALKEGNFLHDAYMRIAGEAEARNTQKRQELTEGERREVFPTETQDVPDAELTIGGKPARGEQQRSEILKSRARPAQPSAEKLARDKAAPATSNTTEVKPTTTAVAGLAPGALGKRGKDLKTPRKLDKTKTREVVEKTFDVIKNQVSQIAGKDRELVEMLLLSKGKLVDQIVAATNAMNRLRNAIDVSSRNIGKGARAKRKSVITGLRLSEIEALLDKANNGKTIDEITAGREGLKNKFPEVFDAWNYSRLEIDKLSIQLMREIMKKERLTNRDAQLIRRMKEQLGVYLTRQYVSNLQDKDVKRNFFNSVLGDWTAMAGMTKEQIAALPEDKKVGFDAKNYIRDFVLDIGNFDEVDSSSDRGSILRFERLYQSWIPGAESLPTDATEAQKDAYFERAKNEMLALKNSMSKDEYLADLEAKAETATKDLIEAYRDGKKNDMVEYFSNLASEGGVLKKRLKVPPPIRRLMGEIVNPILQMHQTQVAMAKEIGRLVFINNIYETQKGEMWVDGVDRKGEAGEVFSRQLTGDKWGRLQGKWVRPDVFETLDIIESIGGNVDSYIQAMNQGRNDLAAGMVVDGALRGVHQASSYTKLSLIVLNPFNALMNYISNFQASLVNGNIPIFTPVTKESREAFKFAHNAAASLIGASNRLGVSPEAREAIKMHLTDSAIMGEYQADDIKKMEEAFISDFASREGAQKFLFGSMAQMGASFKGRIRAAKNFVTDAYAMLDVIGKMYNYKMEEFFLTKLERAKKKENPKYKMMTPEQIKEKARGVIDDTNIGYHRAMPIAKQIEHISFGFLMNYISETGRITANLFQVAEQTRKEANSYPKGSEVRSMLKKRAALRYIGAAMNIFWNQATIELSKYALPLMVAGAMLDGEDDDDEAKKIERLELMMQTAVEAMDPSFRSKAWTAPYIADKKLFLFDGSRTGITEPTTQIAVDAMTGVAKYLMDNEDTEDLDRAAAMAKNLFGAGPLVGMFLKGGKPPLAKQNPQLYREISDAFGGEDTSAARYVSLAVGLLPASATNVAQLVKEDSTLSGASPSMKTAAVFGARFRVLNPRYDIPSSTFELKREVESARKSLREALVGETMSDEEFRDKYLEASEKKVDATKRVLANVSLAKQLGFDEEDIENMLTGTGYGDKRGAGISKKEATVLLRGEPVSVVMQPKDLDSTRDKMIQEVEVKLKEKKITPSQANTMIAEIESKYDRLSAILDEVNDTLVGPN